MTLLSRELAAVVARCHGIVTMAQLLADGKTPSMIKHLVTTGVLVRCHTGVYRMGTSAGSFESQCAAACAADSSIVVTRPAGAWLWQYRHVWRPTVPIVTTTHGRRPVSGNVVIRRTSVLGREDWVLRPDGIRLASPPRTWFDCARDLDDDHFEALTEWVLDHHVGVPTLWRTARRLCRPGRDGAARVARLLSARPGWQKPAASGLELKVFNALVAAGVHGLVRQQTIELPDGNVIHADLALPDIRWALEVDHVTWHGGRLDVQRDEARDRGLRRVGWQVDRVTDAELLASLAATISELSELITLRRREIEAQS